jgi:hypothetical protein
MAAWVVNQARFAWSGATPRAKLRIVLVRAGFDFAASSRASCVSVNQRRPTDQACRT